MLEKYFSGIGIDISEHHIRIAHVGYFGSVIQLKEILLAEGLVIDEAIAKPEELKIILQNGIKKMGLSGKHIRTACLIPESRIFSYSFVLPEHMNREEKKSEAMILAQKEIPLNLHEANITVSQGGREEGGIRTTLYAVETSVYRAFEKTLDSTDFQLVAMESNTKSVYRLFAFFASAQLNTFETNHCLGVLDVGHSWATLSFYTKEGSALFSRTVSYRQFGNLLPINGILTDQIVDNLSLMVQETVVYFQKKNIVCEAFVLAGVEAQQEHIFETIKQNLIKGQVLRTSDIFSSRMFDTLQIQTFGAAIGIALRAAHPQKFIHQHNFI